MEMDLSKIDERFQTVFRDKRFRSIKQKQRKVTIDRRFHSMFTDEKFKLQYNIDKRGKPLQETSAENLKKYYRLPYKEKKKIKLERRKERNRLKNILNEDSQDKTTKIETKEVEQSEEKTLVNNETNKEDEDDPADTTCSKSDESSDEFISSDEESEEEDEIDLARGEGNVESSSEEEGEEYDEDIEMLAGGGHDWEQLDEDAERADEVSSRLALCHMDWDRIKAVDLMVLFDGYKPTGGSIKKVTIYPSDFGVMRMAEENRFGPAELLHENAGYDDKEAARIQNEKFREHQLNRLKYYYAVIECDSKATADAIYKLVGVVVRMSDLSAFELLTDFDSLSGGIKNFIRHYGLVSRFHLGVGDKGGSVFEDRKECDGYEYESSSSKLDLRFIPDEMVFDEHPPKDSADYVPDKDQYKPNNFVTTALNLTKVNLTWDEPDHRRVRLMTRKFKEDELADMDMKDFMASSSDEDAEEQEEIGEEVEEEEDENSNIIPASKIGISSKTTDQDQIARYRSLLLGDMDGDKDESDVDMEITWEPNLEEIAEGEDEPLVSDDDEKAKSKTKDEESANENDINDKPQPKKKGKSKRKLKDEEEVDPMKKAELEMLMIDAEDAKLKHFDIHEIVKDEKMSKKKKRKLGKVEVEDNFKLDMDDSRFSAVFSAPEFSVDPNNPAFRKTKAMKGLVEERQNRLHKVEDDVPIDTMVTKESSTNNSVDVNKLVNSIKTKTKKQFSKKKSKIQRPLIK